MARNHVLIGQCRTSLLNVQVKYDGGQDSNSPEGMHFACPDPEILTMPVAEHLSPISVFSAFTDIIFFRYFPPKVMQLQLLQFDLKLSKLFKQVAV